MSKMTLRQLLLSIALAILCTLGVLGTAVAVSHRPSAATGTEAAPKWEEYQRPNGTTCVGYRGMAVSCFYDPPAAPPPAPPHPLGPVS